MYYHSTLGNILLCYSVKGVNTLKSLRSIFSKVQLFIYLVVLYYIDNK